MKSANILAKPSQLVTCGLMMVALTQTASAQSSQKVAFARGKSSAQVQGTVKGKGYLDYRIGVSAGQSVTVTLKSKSSSVYFNFNPPKLDASMFVGSSQGNTMSRQVPSDGEYIIRVYLMGAAASEGKSAAFMLDIKAAGKALKALPASVDAKLKGTPYHASGPVPCKISLEPNRKECEAFVIRRGNGSATVEFGVGTMVRRVLFVSGTPKAHDSFEKFSFKKAGDTTTLRFGDGPVEEYTVYESLIYGG